MYMCIQKAIPEHFCIKPVQTTISSQQDKQQKTDSANRTWERMFSTMSSWYCEFIPTMKHLAQLKNIMVSCFYQGPTNAPPFPSGHDKLGFIQKIVLSKIQMKKSINIRLSLLEPTVICFIDF